MRATAGRDHRRLPVPRELPADRRDVANLRRFFRETDRDGRRFVWEPRGDWPDGLVRDLCGELDLVHAVDPFRSKTVTTGLAYFRIGRAGERRSYSDEELRRLVDIAARFETAYAMFNNMPRVVDAERFIGMINSRQAPAPHRNSRRGTPGTPRSG